MGRVKIGALGNGLSSISRGQSGPRKWVEVKPLVLVTGAAGYIAVNVIRRLTDEKYKVRGTVRSLQDEAKVGMLKRLFPNLEVFEADLLGGSEAFEKAVEGCKYVIHCASPYKNRVEDAQSELIDPAVKGTEAIMEASLRKGVARVVVTSSTAAIGPPLPWMKDATLAEKSHVFSEKDWNTSVTIENGAYQLSKRMAEQRAWDMAQGAESLALVTVCPAFVIGPMLSDRADGESVAFIRNMLDGTTKQRGCKGVPHSLVDVRDVASAHVAAIEKEEAVGKRFMLTSERGYSKIELAKMLAKDFKAYAIPTEGPEPEYVPNFDATLARELLGFKPRPVEVSMRDMANAAIRNGIVPRRVLLRPVKFGEVGEVSPISKGVDLLVKVVSLEEVGTDQGLYEVVVGDSSGLVTLQLTTAEAAVVQQGSVIEVRNAAAKMRKGYIRLQVGKWGKVSKHLGDAQITPNLDKDVSATEYELVSG